MAKLSLDIEFDYDFLLIGISCHEKDYRLCWAINKQLGIELSKEPDLEIKGKKQVETTGHSLFMFVDEEHYIEYFVITNRSAQGGMLVPEHKQADFLLKVTGAVTPEQKDHILAGLKKLPMVLTSFSINPNVLKSKQNLVF